MTSAVFREIVKPLPRTLPTPCHRFYQCVISFPPFSLRINTSCASVLGIVKSPKLLHELFNLLDTKPDFHSA